MKDFRGVELQVGDLVAVLPPNYRNMVQGKIVKFTGIQATVEYKPRQGCYKDRLETTSRGSGYIAFLERPNPILNNIPDWAKAMVERTKALNKRELTPGIRDALYESFSKDDLPCEVTDGQFCGGIQDVTYRIDGLVYTFTFQQGVLFDAYTENDLQEIK